MDLLTHDELIRIATKFINDEDTCMHSNYVLDGIETYDDEMICHSIKSEFAFGKLGLCGCIDPGFVISGIYNLLNYIDAQQKEDNVLPPIGGKTYSRLYEWSDDENEWTRLFALYTIDTCGLIDHGTSLHYPWLTDLGKDFIIIFSDEDFDPHSEY